MLGKLFGIGVGPGEPDLLTVRAVEILKQAGHIFTPVSRTGAKSVAYKIARRFVPEDTPVTPLLFPMIKDRTELNGQWMENYQKIDAVIRNGVSSAFITLGDSSTYSTFGVVARLFRQYSPDVELVTIPGVTSYCYSAALSGMPLVEGQEILSVASANDTEERIRSVIDSSDTIVFLKTYRNQDRLMQIVKEKGLLDCCTYIKRCGMAGQEVIQDIRNMPDNPEYLSLIVLKKPHQENE